MISASGLAAPVPSPSRAFSSGGAKNQKVPRSDDDQRHDDQDRRRAGCAGAARPRRAAANGLNSSSGGFRHGRLVPVGCANRHRSAAAICESADIASARCSAAYSAVSRPRSSECRVCVGPLRRPRVPLRWRRSPPLRRRALRLPVRSAARSVSLRRSFHPPIATSARPVAQTRHVASGSWCQLCLHEAQRTCRPWGGIAPSFTTYCVPQLGQVRIITTKALFRDGERRVNRNAHGLARQRALRERREREG